MSSVDAVIALSGKFSPEGDLGASTTARMDTAIHLMQLGVASRLIVTGWHAFLEQTPERPLAALMKDYAENHGITQDIFTETEALDTVGNAVFTKLQLTEPNNWKRLTVVTNKFHMPRSLRIFKHVMGPDYTIDGEPAPNQHFPLQFIHERCASLLTRLVLARTQPGDTEKIQQRLFSIVPGYQDMSRPRRLAAIAASIVS